MQQKVVTSLLTLLAHANDLTRCCAARALGKIGAADAVPGLLQSLGSDIDPDVRMEAAAALGRLALSEAMAALCEAMGHDPDGGVRIQACDALGHIGHPTSYNALLAALSGDALLDGGGGDEIEFDAAWVMQRQALELLGDLGDQRAVDPIIGLMEDDGYDDLQDLGFRVLAKLGGTDARGFLLRQLHAGNRLARRRAAQALASVQSTEVVPALSRALQDQDPDVCLAAAQALAARGDPTVVPSLSQLLTHPRDEVRKEVAMLGATLPGDEAGQYLLRLLHDRKPLVQRQAVQVLGDRGEIRAIPHLLTLLQTHQDDDTLTTEIVQALGKLKAADAIVPLCRLLNEPETSPATRLHIVLALGELVRPAAAAVASETPQEGNDPTLDQPDPLAILVDAVDDTDERVCLAALFALGKIGGALASSVLVKALRGERLRTPPESSSRVQEPDVDPAAFPTSTLAAIAAHSAPSSGSAKVDLKARQQTMQRYAARIARDTPHPAVVEALLLAAEAVDPDLQREALVSLGALGDPRALGIALSMLSSASREVQLAAIEVLEKFRGKEAVTPLMAMVREAVDPFVTQRAIEVLGVLGDKQATVCIKQRLSDEDRQVRRVALTALAALGAQDAMESIRPLIFAHGGELRIEAASTLKTLGDMAITDLLLETLIKQDDEENHWIAIEALAELYTC